jgi:broad-specificity NMP kinase
MSEAAVSSLERDKIVQAVIGMNDSPAEQSDGASRRSVVLVTGVSGSGKSTVLTELRRRGHRVIDTDDPGWIVETETDGGPEPVWDLDQVKALIDGHRTGWRFIAGCVANQRVVYDRFDAVVLLSAPLDVILDRAATRANPFGSTAEDRTKIAYDLAAFEPPLRAGADCEIVTTAPIATVAAALEQVASGGGHRDPLRSRRAHRT